jgi:hypothetical protein
MRLASDELFVGIFQEMHLEKFKVFHGKFLGQFSGAFLGDWGAFPTNFYMKNMM